MMKKLMALLGGVGFVAGLQGCAVETGEPEDISSVSALATSTMTVNNWGSGYCVDVTIPNDLAVSSNTWSFGVDMKGFTPASSWNTKWTVLSSGHVSFGPVDYNKNIAPGGVVQFGFCVNGNTTNKSPTKLYHLMSSTQYANCNTSMGLHPTRAALAVAMATELGRWTPESDLYTGSDGKVQLTAGALTKCGSGGCPHTKGLLGHQDEITTSLIGSSLSSAPACSAPRTTARI
jgi:hypothetical protein